MIPILNQKLGITFDDLFSSHCEKTIRTCQF
jgi:hypothetical protein